MGASVLGWFSDVCSRPTPQQSVREINGHLFGGSRYCYVDLPAGRRIRISRARTRMGTVEGRVILGSDNDWEAIPASANVELS